MVNFLYLNNNISDIDPVITDNIINNFLSELERKKFKKPNDSQFFKLMDIENNGVKVPYMRHKFLKNHKERLIILFTEYNFLNHLKIFKNKVESISNKKKNNNGFESKNIPHEFKSEDEKKIFNMLIDLDEKLINYYKHLNGIDNMKKSSDNNYNQINEELAVLFS